MQRYEKKAHKAILNMNESIGIEEEMVSKLEQPIGKQKVLEMAAICVDDENVLKVFFKLMFHTDPLICFRAAWVLETTAILNEAAIQVILPEFIDKFPSITNLSCKRHITRIIIVLNKQSVDAPVYKNYRNFNLDKVVDALFLWLVDENTPVAVKANCMEALTGFINTHTWVKDELIATVDYLSCRESVAFYGRLKKIRRYLNP